jgi:hypothetical protein
MRHSLDPAPIFGEVSQDNYWPDWNVAASSSGQADPFCCSPAWQLSFHNSYAPNRRLFIRESSNNVVAFAEKIISGELVLLTPIESSWLFGNPLLGEHSVDLFSDMLADIEKYYSPVSPRIIISGIRPYGSLYKKLKRRFADEFKFCRYSSGVQCSASLTGGVDGYLSKRSANFRRKTRKETRKALSHGVTLERVSPNSNRQVDETYSRMLSVELASWKGIGRCGMAEAGPKKFYEVMMKHLAITGDARVIFAKHGGKDIGFIFGGVAEGVYRGQQFSYDEEWQSASIGNVLQMEQVDWSCEEGLVRYDMGPLEGPKMSYKTHWTERKHNIETWILDRK